MRSYPITPTMKKLPITELFDQMAAKLVEFAQVPPCHAYAEIRGNDAKARLIHEAYRDRLPLLRRAAGVRA